MLRYHSYAAKTVSQWTLTFSLHNHVTETCYTKQTILNLNCIYQTSILRPLPAKLNHFYLFDPCRAKKLTSDLFFNNFETVRRRYAKLYFFWIVIIRGIWWYGFWQHWSNFWIWLLYKLSCDPQASCIGCDPAAIWNGDPWTHTNIIKLSNLLFLFSWVNFRSFRPKRKKEEAGCTRLIGTARA